MAEGAFPRQHRCGRDDLVPMCWIFLACPLTSGLIVSGALAELPIRLHCPRTFVCGVTTPPRPSSEANSPRYGVPKHWT